MTFDNPEVVELGTLDLIQDVPWMDNTEGTVPSRTRVDLTVYAAEAE